MTQIENNSSQNGTTAVHPPHPEVIPQARRRTFTAKYKLWVLQEADKCREQPGQIGRLLRREGLYASHLTSWRQQREAGQLAGLSVQKRGRKSDKEAAEISRLKQENNRLEQQLTQAELIIEAQKKLSAIFESMVGAGREKNK